MLAVDPQSGKLTVDRTYSGLVAFHPAFSTSVRHEAPVEITDGKIILRFLLDTSSLEVFAQGGTTCLTEQIFPTAGKRRITLSSDGGRTLTMLNVDRITIYALRSALVK